MIDLHLIVQRECVIARAPVVTDARFAVHDQRVHIQVAQARRNRQAGVAAANDQHIGVTVGAGGVGDAPVKPVRPLKIARVRLTARPAAAGVFFKAFDLVCGGEQGPGLVLAIAAGVRVQTQQALRAQASGFEAEKSFDDFGTGAGDAARRCALGIDFKKGGVCRIASCVARSGPRAVCAQCRSDGLGPTEGLDVPGQSQQIAPMRVRPEQGFESCVV